MFQAIYPNENPGTWELFGWSPGPSTAMTSAHGNIKITGQGTFGYGEPPSLFSIRKDVQTETRRKRKFARISIDGFGNWESYDAQGDGTTLGISDSFLFVGKKGCAKPCTTGNWVDVPQPPGEGLDQGTFSASPGNVYNIKFTNGTYRTYRGTGTGQGSWVEVPALQNKIPLATSIDNKAIYATPTDPSTYGNLERCSYPYDSASQCKNISTSGRKIQSVTVNPATSRVWITTKESASNGNIFQRLDDEDPSAIISDVETREQGLQRDVNSLGGEIRITQAEVTSGKLRKEASDVIREATNLTGNISGVYEESDKLKSEITQAKKQTAGYKNKMLPLQILTFTLAVVLLIYLVAGFVLPSTVTSIVAVLALAGGLAAAIYFAVVSK